MKTSTLTPDLDDWSQPFYAAAAEGRLVVQRCSSCGAARWTPRPMCPRCHSLAAEWSEVLTAGRIWSFCVVHPPVIEELREKVPFVVVLVELEDEPAIHMLGDLVGATVDADVSIGVRVTAQFDSISDDVALVRWALV